ncbi:MAG: VCBS repeat-containing protein, partial [Planctomycetes bacterium]|nr:VCBS repeat-containing protein [Planctomycetota bacterium]
SNAISVLLNNGTDESGAWLGFAPAQNYDVSAVGPWEVALGHLNGDTALDVAVANRSSHNVSVLLNDGNGVFGPAATFDVGNNPESITAEDLNGDQFGDLAVANFASDTVSILINNGDGTFAPAVNVGVGTYPFGASPRSVIAARLDEDEFVDLAVANRFSNNISVLINNGDGTFTKLVNLDVAENPESVTAGDLNGDGVVDLAVAHFSSDNLSVFLNQTPPFGTDCNDNAIPDDCDIASGTSFDINGNGVPDECEPNGDVDQDGDVDLDDLEVFLPCARGPGGGADPPCDEFDFDLDSDVDFNDFAAFQRAFTGP